MSYRDDYRESARAARFFAGKAALWILALVVVAFLIAVVTTPLTIGFGWFQGEAQLRSFQHVKETYQVAFDDANALDALAQQSCVAGNALNGARATGDLNTINQRQDQLIAITNNYDRVRGEYDAYMRDHFRGKVIHPATLPIPYPTIEEKQSEVC